MKKFILGKKVGMTQVFNEEGQVIPVTVVEAGPCVVIQTKTVEKEGYSAVKVAYDEVNKKSLNKPQKGVFEKANITPKKHLKEFRIDDISGYEVGKEISVADMFETGDKIDVSGISKGKGFQGSIKRHGQSRGRMTHGSHFHRSPGSLGACSTPGRVFKGKQLPGHMGTEKVTVQNLVVVSIDKENNLLLVRGALPGVKGALLTISDAVKTR